MIAEARAWWDGRSRREQWLLGVLAAVALTALLLVALVKPLQAARSAALADIRTYQSLAQRLRAMEPGMRAAPMRTGGTPAILSASAASAGLALGPVAGDGTVRLADVSYDGVLRWVADVEATSNLRLAGIVITPGPAPGRVAAEVRFR